MGELQFLLNAMLFVLIGLQLPAMLEGLDDEPAWTLLGCAVAVSLAVILTRLVWQHTTVFSAGVDRRESQRARRATWRYALIGAWSGMRGAVSLAAALALPTRLPAARRDRCS